MVTAKDIGINLCFFIYNDVIAYNKHYTLTLSNILTKIFSWVGGENKNKIGIKFFCICKRRGGLATLQRLARKATVYRCIIMCM